MVIVKAAPTESIEAFLEPGNLLAWSDLPATWQADHISRPTKPPEAADCSLDQDVIPWKISANCNGVWTRLLEFRST